MRRFTRLTNAFSKKVENHAYAVAVHMIYTASSNCTARFPLLLQWPLAAQLAFGKSATLSR